MCHRFIHSYKGGIYTQLRLRFNSPSAPTVLRFTFSLFAANLVVQLH